MFLSPDNLVTHPKNLRRFYPEDQVREIAESIKASKGVYQAMLIVPNGKAGRFFVVDGNMRLAGARILGKACPLLKCELVDQTTAEQFLTMAATAKFRYDPDPISEALHYKRLMEEEGYKIPQLARAIGVAATTIYIQMKLLELDKEIQNLIAARKLPRDNRVVEALLSVSDARARVKLAERLASMNAGIKAIVAACERLRDDMGHRKTAIGAPAPRVHGNKPAAGAPAVVRAEGRTFGRKMAADQKVKIKEIRKQARIICEACDIRETSVKSSEPAWSLISHAADETCTVCSVREMKNACAECPVVDFLRRLIKSLGEKRL